MNKKIIHRNKIIFTFFMLVLFFACKTQYSSVQREGHLIVLDSSFHGDSVVLSIIEPYKSILDVEMNEIIAYSEIAITKSQPEGALNNFVSDLVLEVCNRDYIDGEERYDVAIFNNGGLRAALPKGLITVEDVYKLMPFENEAVVLTLAPDKFIELVEYIIRSGGVPMAGMRILVREQKLAELTINGEAFDSTRNYRVVTSDYLAFGGDRMEFFQNPIEMKSLSVLIRDMIIEYLREQNVLGNKLHPKVDGRMQYE
jgi:2',3'-cyclic-nucleotide 2'-phosphodiesterase (5'-nucleotidase family)